ncbi:MAG: hypothetical protein QNJ98_13105 [Planctomycetota bacterium]|nr:hypothetical protein [Planctomycetota bacterium]
MTARDGMLAGRNPDDLDRAERRELISAYLDGELPAHEARQITHWLDENPGALKEVEHIRRTWDLLEHYEDEPVPDGFAQRVVRAVGIERAAGARGRVIPMAWYRRPQALMSLAAVLVLAIGLPLVLSKGPGDVVTPPAVTTTSAADLLETVPDELLLQLDTLANLDDEVVDSVLSDDLADFATLLSDTGG